MTRFCVQAVMKYAPREGGFETRPYMNPDPCATCTNLFVALHMVETAQVSTDSLRRKNTVGTKA
jgi:hypothetical protein